MPPTIHSPHNQKLKEIRKLCARRREREGSGRFVAEGEDLLAAADRAGWTPLERLCAAGSGLPGTEVEPRLLVEASGLASGTRAIGVYAERWASDPAGPLCVYLHEIHDPGNVGAVLRSAEAFGVDSVVLGVGSADPFGPKAVRASMGAIFTIPVVRADRDVRLPGRTIALVAGRGAPLHELGLRPGESLSLMIGSERDGLPEDVVAAADVAAHIPIASHSLNAAMAATVALYETTRMAR